MRSCDTSLRAWWVCATTTFWVGALLRPVVPAPPFCLWMRMCAASEGCWWKLRWQTGHACRIIIDVIFMKVSPRGVPSPPQNKTKHHAMANEAAAAAVDAWIAQARPGTEIEARLGRWDGRTFQSLWPATTPSLLSASAATTRLVDHTLADGRRVTLGPDGEVLGCITKERRGEVVLPLGDGVAAKLVHSLEQAQPSPPLPLRRSVFVRRKTRRSRSDMAAGWRVDVTAVSEGVDRRHMTSGVNVEVEWLPGGTSAELLRVCALLKQGLLRAERKRPPPQAGAEPPPPKAAKLPRGEAGPTKPGQQPSSGSAARRPAS